LSPDIQLGGYTFAAELVSAVLKRRMRTTCARYKRSDRLFSGSPALWSSTRDNELIDFAALVQEHGSEVVGVPNGFGKIVDELDPALVEWLSRTNPKSPFFVRLAPDRFYTQKPPMMLTEAAIAPGRFDALMKFDMYSGQREYGEYELQKGTLDVKNPTSYIDYRASRRGAEALRSHARCSWVRIRAASRQGLRPRHPRSPSREEQDRRHSPSTRSHPKSHRRR
jgi:hypothetical protein